MGFQRLSLIVLSAGFFVGAVGDEALAQITVQQPQVQVFGLDTSVSVPDRGGIYLGGVNQGAIGSQTYGPFWWGSSLGWSYSATNASAHVWIHDLQAMDRAILAEAQAQDRAAWRHQYSRSIGTIPPLPPSPVQAAVQVQAARARDQLLRQHRNRLR